MISLLRDNLALGACLVLAAMATGCTPPPAPPARSTVAQDIDDPCAEQLHDTCSQLLLYCRAHGQLPERLEDLNKPGTGPAPRLICPISGKPYVYNPKGLEVPRRTARLILYDAQPCRRGTRCAVLSEPFRPGHALVTDVVRIPDAAVVWENPRSPNEPGADDKGPGNTGK